MKLFLFLLPLLSAMPLYAQQNQASLLLAQNKLDEAKVLFIDQLKQNPGDSSVIFSLARIALLQHEYESAANYLRDAATHHYPETEVAYLSARLILSEDGNAGEALKELESGAEAGMRHFIPLMQDPLFSKLRDEPGWTDLINKVEINTYPCLSNENNRAFDFWLGSWDVYANNVKVGDSRITRANGGCAIHENYTTYPRDYSGQSINFYDPRDQIWHQHWVGSGGDVTNYLETNRSDNMLEFTGKSLVPTGNEITYRMTFTLLENGNVRQHIESSSDDGESWATAFDGIYIPAGN